MLPKKQKKHSNVSFQNIYIKHEAPRAFPPCAWYYICILDIFPHPELNYEKYFNSFYLGYVFHEDLYFRFYESLDSELSIGDMEENNLANNNTFFASRLA